MIVLPGYDDRGPDAPDGPGLAYDGADLMDRPGFWAAHLIEAVEADLDGELALLFNHELDTVRATYRQLTDTAAWPAFPVDLGGGARLVVVRRNVDEDEGVDYLLVPADGANCVQIATVEGALEGPGLSWDELVAVADRQPGALAQATALLLLAPMLGDTAAESSGAVTRLAAALRTVGVTGQVVTIAEAIVAAAPAAWHRTADGVNICDSEYSTRNPSSLVALKPADLRTVSDLLATGRG
ncbi:hypothetical protein [Micromonospora chokoriensis]|uniref:hypothetical protein n=1 Tax=Micromonospora chokoriensis TaxID=356851 RepID=UPI000B5ACD90|nr:hypothetical protein [Micromonospora chokoriensis]